MPAMAVNCMVRSFIVSGGSNHWLQAAFCPLLPQFLYQSRESAAQILSVEVNLHDVGANLAECLRWFLFSDLCFITLNSSGAASHH